jgi:calcineurin-like phosphoesterase family protein
VTTWFTADLHLGHRNIIDYCNRPFRDVEAMNNARLTRGNGCCTATSTTAGPRRVG